MASQNLAYAMNSEFELRDRFQHQIDVRNGNAIPIFILLGNPKKDKHTEAIKNTFKVIQLNFEQARLLHGTVDRFLRIDVVDPADVGLDPQPPLAE